MVFPGDNPPPSDPFAPAPPPGGPYAPGPLTPGPIGPSSFQPAPSSGSSAWKYILIGCLAIIILGGIVTVGSCAFLASKGGSAMPKLIKFVKSEYVKNLSADHTPEQKARFEEAYDFYANQAEKLGFMEWINKYSDIIDKLTTIDQDGSITVEESQAWADEVLSGGTGETGGEGETEGGAEGEGAGTDAGDAGADSGGDSGDSGGGSIDKEGPESGTDSGTGGQ